MNNVSVIVVSWNARRFLSDCLLSIRETSASCVREVIVVDNASSDGSPEMVEECFPEVTLIRSTSNLGFARANNLALQHVDGSIVAFLNSDVVLHRDCLDVLATFLNEHPEVGLVGPRIVGRDGRVQGTCRRLPTIWNNFCRTFALDRVFPSLAFISGHEMRHFGHDVVAETEVLSGCLWVARKCAIDVVGELDEQFFFYMEDVDWCRRFADLGWKVMFIPNATAVHFGGASTSNAPLRYAIQYHRANLSYWQKYYGLVGKSAYYILATLHHGLRFMYRGLRKMMGSGRSPESRHKFHEDVVCLRWLFTGKTIE